MIEYVRGDILAADAEALVNTVNTVGIMGKGIALQFKRRFPGNFAAYKAACDVGDVVPGRMFVWQSDQLGNPRWIVNFPTKRHWRAKSRIEDIEAGLRDLVSVVRDNGIASIAIPPLGCGHGGLDWESVRPLIHAHMAQLEHVQVEVFEPAGAPAPAAMPAAARRPRLTPHRATMVLTFDRYLEPGFTLGRLEAQKLLYFLQTVGAPYDRLVFSKGDFGPYSPGVTHVLNDVEGHLLVGFGDGDVPSELRPAKGAVDQAVSLLAMEEHRPFRDAVDAVASLVTGFDDAFGLELLASVHWVASHQEPRARNATEAAAMVQEWTARKRARYDLRQVRAAWSQLEEHGLVTTEAPDPPATTRSDTTIQTPEIEGSLVAAALGEAFE